MRTILFPCLFECILPEEILEDCSGRVRTYRHLFVICLEWITSPSGEGQQNAAHLMKCKEIGDRKGRSIEQAREDPEWCAAVFDFLQDN